MGHIWFVCLKGGVSTKCTSRGFWIYYLSLKIGNIFYNFRWKWAYDLGFMISVNQRSALSCSGMLGVWCEMQQTLVLSCSLPPALTLLVLCLCPKGVACFVLAALLLCTDRCISAQQASGAGAVNWTDNRSWDGWGAGDTLWMGSEPCTLEAAQLCPGAQHPWNKHLPDSLWSFYLA